MADEYTITKTEDGVLYLAKNGTIQERLYRMKEALQRIGITAPTYYRWVNSAQIQDVRFRDRANWRLFTEGDIQRIKAEATKVNIVSVVPPRSQEEGESGSE
jgi:hypothetical protein